MKIICRSDIKEVFIDNMIMSFNNNKSLRSVGDEDSKANGNHSIG